jgi:hypothetical protein
MCLQVNVSAMLEERLRHCRVPERSGPIEGRRPEVISRENDNYRGYYIETAAYPV